MFNIIDNESNQINLEDIVKHENLETGKTVYYLVGEKMMYQYDESGLFSHESFKNIKIDRSVTLVNNEVSVWTRLGKEFEVYNEIFG